MTDRVKRMKERATHCKFPLCIERMRISFDVLEQRRGDSPLKMRSFIHAAVLEKIPIAIEEDDLICGIGASKPNGIEMDYEIGPWSPDEIAAIKEEGMYVIDPKDEADLYSFVERFTREGLGVTTTKKLGEVVGDDRLWPFMKTGMNPPIWKSKIAGAGGGKAQSGLGFGAGAYLVVPDFATILNEGGRSVVNRAKKELEDLRYYHEDAIDRRYWYEGVIRIYEAWFSLAHRYADLADKMASEEKDEKRAAELRQMAETCRWVPENPARSFREAIQAFWFVFLLTCPSPTAAAGRFDQYMYPFYKKDIESGAITREEALELLEILRIKDFQLNRINGKEGRLKNAGMAKWHNWTLGGCDKDGNDVSNELTLLEFEAAKETYIPHHTITLRVNENTPLEVIAKGLEVTRTGIGMPAFVGDQSYINFFVNHNCTLEDSRDYCMAGCVDGVIQGVTRVGPAPMFVVAQAYDIFLHNGWCPFTQEDVGIKTGDVTTFETFEEHMEGFKKQLHFLLGLACEKFNMQALATRQLTPEYFISSLLRGGIEEGKDLMTRHMKPYDSVIVCSAVGVINVADSMAAIKKLVYMDKKYTMKQVLEAIDANWEGYEEMQKDFLNAPKYGNDDDLPDLIARELYSAYAHSIESYDTVTGGKVIANAISITAHQPGGKVVGALPDGRKKNEILADASLSPYQGRDKNGIMAVFNSAMKVNQDDYQATLMNMKFHPTALKTDDDLMKLASLIKTYLTHGGKHIQFNVTTKEALEAAMAEPEKHSDLIVRVAGYSAYYTLLSPVMQKEILDRTQYDYL